MIAKIVGYEENPPDPEWSTDVLLIADDDEPIFAEMTDRLVARLPHYYTVRRIDVEAYPPAVAPHRHHRPHR